MSKSRRELQLLIEALDDIPLDDDIVQETVAKLGLDPVEGERQVLAQIAAADERDRKIRAHERKLAYEADLARLEGRAAEPRRTREEQLGIYRALLARAPANAPVAMHFHKFESVSDEDLAELTRSLRHLLGEDGDE